VAGEVGWARGLACLLAVVEGGAMGHCDCHTSWDCGRRVGSLVMAELCHCCGATCPNSWSAPRGYVQDGHGHTYCDVRCEAAEAKAEGLAAMVATTRLLLTGGVGA
jgi:hypothetical protein